MRQTVFQIGDIAMPGQTDLKPQFYFRSDLLMSRFKCIHKLFDIAVEKRSQSPDIFTDFKNCNTVLPIKSSDISL